MAKENGCRNSDGNKDRVFRMSLNRRENDLVCVEELPNGCYLSPLLSDFRGKHGITHCDRRNLVQLIGYAL
jgi:hypothetical protein